MFLLLICRITDLVHYNLLNVTIVILRAIELEKFFALLLDKVGAPVNSIYRIIVDIVTIIEIVRVVNNMQKKIWLRLNSQKFLMNLL